MAESVAVSPEFRRQGVISVFLNEILERGRKNGYPCAQLDVLINNTPASLAYEKQGFRFHI